MVEESIYRIEQKTARSSMDFLTSKFKDTYKPLYSPTPRCKSCNSTCLYSDSTYCYCLRCLHLIFGPLKSWKLPSIPGYDPVHGRVLLYASANYPQSFHLIPLLLEDKMMLLTQHPGKWSPSFKSQPVQVSVIKEYNIGEVYIHDITTERIELFTNIEEFSCSHEDFFRIVNQALVAENPKAVLAALRMKL